MRLPSKLSFVLLQVDPQCVIQYVHWYHEPETGEKRLIKTGRNSTEPYSHVIEEVLEADFGRYYCLIANVMGETECSAYLSIRSSATILLSSYITFVTPILTSLSMFLPCLLMRILYYVNNGIQKISFHYNSWSYVCEFCLLKHNRI